MSKSHYLPNQEITAFRRAAFAITQDELKMLLSAVHFQIREFHNRYDYESEERLNKIFWKLFPDFTCSRPWRGTCYYRRVRDFLWTIKARLTLFMIDQWEKGFGK